MGWRENDAVVYVFTGRRWGWDVFYLVDQEA